MKMGVILPTTKLFGGVKRFLELGNIFAGRGHDFTVLSPDGVAPQWFPYVGKIDRLNNIGGYSFDVLFITETEYLDVLRSADARMKVFYCVSESQAAKLKRVVKERSVVIFVCSGGLGEYVERRYGVRPVMAVGAVDCAVFKPREMKNTSEVTTILAYGRLNKRGKGTALVVRACESLYRKGYKIRLLLFDTPTDPNARQLVADFKCGVPFEFVIDHPVMENYKLFQRADIYVGAERKAGWSNTCAEAMAAGLAVVATKHGTADILEHNITGLIVRRHWWFVMRGLKKLLDSPALRLRLAENGFERIQRFTWTRLADDILMAIDGHIGRAAQK